jgi:hypothetical protein
MNDHELTSDPRMLIGSNQWDVPVCVPLSAYLQFTRHMDVQLRRLVACWGHLAAPAARGKPKGLSTLQRRVSP